MPRSSLSRTPTHAHAYESLPEAIGAGLRSQRPSMTGTCARRLWQTPQPALLRCTSSAVGQATFIRKLKGHNLTCQRN